MSLARARRHLDAIAAAPRPAGSDAERVARHYCARVLRAAGYATQEEPFSYSALPGRWGTPVSGALSILCLAVAACAGSHHRAFVALAVLATSAVALSAGGWWLARSGVLSLPMARAHSVNLVATRSVPSVWLMAHIDSKSQPVSIAIRAVGVLASLGVWLGALAVALWQTFGGGAAQVLWPWIALAGALAGLPVVASVVGTRSPGALDDASGVATVLLAAEELARTRRDVGVVITSAEELGLAGARAWVRARTSTHGPGVAVNVDGVDDAGVLRVTMGGRRPERLVRALTASAERAGMRVRARRLVPGVLLDAVALADAGWEAVTVSRGALATVLRIHTPRDVVGHMTGRGIDESARVIGGAVRQLLDGER